MRGPSARLLRFGLVFAPALMLACGSDGGGGGHPAADASPVDAAPDARPVDAHVQPDATPPDATPPDATPADAAADATPPDAAIDAAPDALPADAAPDAAVTAACANGADDDDDGQTDYPLDPGCEGAADTDEADPAQPACGNGMDDDGDGLTDADDPGCAGPADPSEANACGEMQTFRDITGQAQAQGDTRGQPAVFDPSCRHGTGPEAVLLYTVREPLRRLVIDTRGSGFDTVLSVRTACDDAASERACNDDDEPRRTSRLAIDAPPPGDYFIVVDGLGDAAGPFTVNVRAEVADGSPCPPEGGALACAIGSTCRDGTCVATLCGNGVDDDHDGKIDFPADPGCAAPDDDDEADPPMPPQCADMNDNDFDGQIDFPDDPDCESAGDPDESSPPECGDGRDNDQDGKIDLADPGCTNLNDFSEFNAPACHNGQDDDMDGKVDYPADPGCASTGDDDEADPDPLPQCADGADNDGDGLIDFPADADGCRSAADDDEGSPCVGLQPLDITGRPVAAGNLGEAHNEFDAPCAPGTGNEWVLRWRVAADRPLASMRLSTRDTQVPVAVHVRDHCDAEMELGCGANRNYPYETVVQLGPQAAGTELLIFVEGVDGISEGIYRLAIDARLAEGARCDGGNWHCADGLACRRDGEGVSRCTPSACADGMDNDADGTADYPGDPGCATPGDDDEADPDPLPECANGVDDDGDGAVDFGGDPNCQAAGDDSEGPDCSNGVDDDGDGKSDYGDVFLDPHADDGCACPDDQDEGPQPECADGCDNDGDGLADMEDPGCASPDDDQEFNVPQCQDDEDNDGDGRVDFPADPGCTNPNDQTEADPDPLPACADGIDNDEDGRIDFAGIGDGPADDGCSAAADDSELGPCDMPQTPLPDTGVARGTTAVGLDNQHGSCNSFGQAPDAGFVAHVPYHAQVVANTFNSTYDTVLYARSECSATRICPIDPPPDAPACDPNASTELACNDDSAGLQSQVAFDWPGGDLFLFVDGFGQSGGDFTLTVTATYPAGGPCDPDGPAYARCALGTACQPGPGDGESTCQPN
jgi:hypothetical protein